jgi:ribonucleoside-diphosphate reductase alpha chain
MDIGKIEVIKRNGKSERLCFDKIVQRINTICKVRSISLEADEVLEMVKTGVQGVYNQIKTNEIDKLLYENMFYQSMKKNGLKLRKLASDLYISNLHKMTTGDIHKLSKIMYGYGILSKDYFDFVTTYKKELNAMLDFDRDYDYDYIGCKVLERSYLFRDRVESDRILERPQLMLLRVAIGIWTSRNTLDESALVGTIPLTIEQVLTNIKNTYQRMSSFECIHATPTLFNAGTNKSNYSSCFLLGVEDSIEGIYKCISDCAIISKNSGGLGLHMSNIRGTGSIIKSSNRHSTGIVPMLKVINETMRYVNQGGKRNGSIAVYLEPHHIDVLDFLDLRKNHGRDEKRCRDVFISMYITNYFMKCVEDDLDWYLFADTTVFKNLDDLYGDEYVKAYTQYTKDFEAGLYSGEAVTKTKARTVWNAIVTSQIETGTPYIVYKDSVNFKSNHANVGTVKSSNLCAEIVQYSDHKSYGVCNLASVCLPYNTLVDETTGKTTFDFDKCRETMRTLVENLNQVININNYPVPETKKNNQELRPIAVGVSGVADLFVALGISFVSAEARDLFRRIVEHMYYYALYYSNQFVKEKRYPCYPNFKGSPLSRGKFQFEMHNEYMRDHLDAGYKGFDIASSASQIGKEKWEALRADIIEHGVSNSLLLAFMPTASTSQILGVNESFEPFHALIFNKRLLSGEFIYVNKSLVNDLEKLNLWDRPLMENILRNEGTIQHIDCIPISIKEKYKTLWDVTMREYIDFCAEFIPFIDQSLSMNLFSRNPSAGKISSMHFYAWKKGFKTGIYYLRTRAATNPIPFTLEGKRSLATVSHDTVPAVSAVSVVPTTPAPIVCPRRRPNANSNNDGGDDGVCLACSG